MIIISHTVRIDPHHTLLIVDFTKGGNVYHLELPDSLVLYELRKRCLIGEYSLNLSSENRTIEFKDYPPSRSTESSQWLTLYRFAFVDILCRTICEDPFFNPFLEKTTLDDYYSRTFQ